MEQIQQLLDLLKQTPEMTLWGFAIYFLFILLKAASWIGALTLVTKLFITRYFDWANAKLHRDERLKEYEEKIEKIKSENSYEMKKAREIQRTGLLKVIEKNTYDSPDSVVKLLMAIGDGSRAHSTDIDRATEIIIKHKQKKISAN